MSIQLFTPTFRVDECLEEIRICLEKGWTGLGFKTVELEEKWKAYTGLPHAHYLNSATVGLDLAFEIFKRERGWMDGDEVISTPLTFVSTNHAILYNNLKPVFADVDQYLCLDPADVRKKITSKTRAILFVGLGGSTGQWQEIVSIAQEHKLALILDAAHMAGTRLGGKVPGAEADAVVYSFQAVKNLPTADSGMVCFRDANDDAICRKLTWLGINKDTYARSGDKGSYKWKYDVEYLGYKYHGNSIMAAIGLVQLKYLDQDNAFRRQLAQWYQDGFTGVASVTMVPVPAGCESSRHLFQIVVKDREGLLGWLNEAEIYPGVHYRDNTEYGLYAQDASLCPRSREYSEGVLSLPMHLRMSKQDVDTIVSRVKEFAKGR